VLWPNTARNEEADKLNLVLLDGRIVKRFSDTMYGPERPSWEPWGLYLAAEPLPVRSPYERVVAFRGAGGLGSHWDTVFYGFTGGRMTFIGRAPGQNANGPVNWKGHRDLWLFDDRDIYRREEPVTRHLLFKVEPNRTMLRMRGWPSTKAVATVVRVLDESTSKPGG